VVAAAGGAFSLYIPRRIDLAAVATVVALIGAVIVEIWLLTDRPEEAWYDGRALAESAKTLAWRFAVGGAPFDNSIDTQTAEMRLIEQLTALLHDAPGSGIGVGNGAAITQPMRELRTAGLDERRRAYISERIDSQRRWYESKALHNQKAARRWRLALLAIESAGVFAALLRAIGVVNIDLAGIAAAIAAAGVAWLSLKQHESLARAYAYAATELALATTRLQNVSNEGEWSTEVDNAESAISREHTMWRANRTTI
jgi:SMODS and SLOG-associating 2TM effector domain 1/SMODS and SLOG-associating 2TM effector domain 3